MNISCALRWGVTLVGVILIRHCSPRCGTHLSSTGHMKAADPHPGPHVRRRPTCGLDKSFCTKCLEQLVLARNFV